MSAKKTEEFLDRLTSSLTHIREHIQTPFDMEYAVITKKAEETIKKRSEELAKVLEKLGLTYSVSEIKLPEVKLEYSEIPDENIEQYVSDMLNLSEQLLLKIRKFIKQNHVFGAFYAKTNSAKFKVKMQDVPFQLKKHITVLEKTLDKKYVVDILSDGSGEVCEMLDVLGRALLW